MHEMPRERTIEEGNHLKLKLGKFFLIFLHCIYIHEGTYFTHILLCACAGAGPGAGAGAGAVGEASPRCLLQLYALLKRRSEAALVVEPRLNRSLSGKLSRN